MTAKAALACALLALCLPAARADSDSGSDFGGEGMDLNRRRLLAGRRPLATDAALAWRKGLVAIDRVLGCWEPEGGPCMSVEEVLDAVHNKVVNLTVLAIESERPDPRLEAWLGGAFAYFFQDLETNSSAGSGGRPSNFSTADVHAAVSDLDFCPLAAGNVLNITARLDEETLFEGAPVRADFPPGVVVEVLVGHVGELEARGHTPQLSAHLADSGPGPDGATGTC